MTQSRSPISGRHLSPLEFYIVLALFVTVSVGFAYGLNVIPHWVALAAVSTVVIVGIGYGVHERVATAWWSYLAVTITGIVIAAIAYAVGPSLLGFGVVVGWAGSLLALMFHNLTTRAGQSASLHQETWATALTGAVIAFLFWWEGYLNHAAVTIAILLILSVVTFVHETGSVGAQAREPS